MLNLPLLQLHIKNNLCLYFYLTFLPFLQTEILKKIYLLNSLLCTITPILFIRLILNYLKFCFLKYWFWLRTIKTVKLNKKVNVIYRRKCFAVNTITDGLLINYDFLFQINVLQFKNQQLLRFFKYLLASTNFKLNIHFVVGH